MPSYMIYTISPLFLHSFTCLARVSTCHVHHSDCFTCLLANVLKSLSRLEFTHPRSHLYTGVAETDASDIFVATSNQYNINSFSICFCRREFPETFCGWCYAFVPQDCTPSKPKSRPPIGENGKTLTCCFGKLKAKSCRSKPKQIFKKDLLAAPHSTRRGVSWHTFPLWPAKKLQQSRWLNFWISNQRKMQNLYAAVHFRNCNLTGKSLI